MRTSILAIILTLSFITNASAATRTPYSAYQVNRGIYSFFHEVVSPSLSGTIRGKIVCWRNPGSPARYRCVVNFRRIVDGHVVERSRWSFTKGRIRWGNCNHSLYYLSGSHQYRARVRIFPRTGQAKGCIVFRLNGSNLPDPENL